MATPVSIGTLQNKTSESATVLTTTVAVPAGALACVAISVEANAVTTTVANVDSVTDSAGNTYTLAIGRRTGSASSNIGGSLFYKENAAALPIGGTITVDWAGSAAPIAKAVSAFFAEGVVASGALDATGYAVGTSAAPSASSSAATTQANELTIGLIASRGPIGDSFTQDSSVAYASPPNRTGTTGDTASTNRTIAGGHFVESATGTKTYAPTITSREFVALIATFRLSTTTVATYTRATAWRIQATAQRASAWRVMAQAVRPSAWRVLAASVRPSAWRIAAARTRPIAWRVMDSTGREVAWRVQAQTTRGAAWRVLARWARAIGWQIGDVVLPPPSVVIHATPRPRLIHAAPRPRLIHA